jgi:hypothetical protein
MAYGRNVMISVTFRWTLSLKERPQVMAVHKGREWMVVGVGKRLVVLVARK